MWGAPSPQPPPPSEQGRRPTPPPPCHRPPLLRIGRPLPCSVSTTFTRLNAGPRAASTFTTRPAFAFCAGELTLGRTAITAGEPLMAMVAITLPIFIG